MAGIYIHVPFCKQLCYYCDFHFSLSLRFKDDMLASILQEVNLRSQYLDKQEIKTVYFGGGTPSVLQIEDLRIILAKLSEDYTISPTAEITLEANPDDLTVEYLNGLKSLGFNRLSIGIQSFIDDELRTMNRRHTANEGEQAVHRAKEMGFENITLDLIYGLPNSTLQTWEYSLQRALDLDIQHFSCYHLGIEAKTAFANFKKNGQITEVDENNSLEQYNLLCEYMKNAGYEHYEVSNFAKPNFYSQHNSSYWNGTPYLGLGPSAHSFNGLNRQWNINHNRRYMEAISRGTSFYEVEELSTTERFNDYLITHLRTSKGVNLHTLETEFPRMYAAFAKGFEKYSASDLGNSIGGYFHLTEKGLFQSDAIIADLFQVE